MRKKILCWVLVLILTLSLAPTAFAADGYNEHDFNKLKTFLNQPSSIAEMTNGEFLNPDYDPEAPETWTGVTWSTDAEKRVTNIAFGYGGAKGSLAGPLDVSGCTALKQISCYNNALTSLDASGCTALEQISSNENALTSLNVSDCTALIGISCSDNALTSLDVSDQTEVTYLYCGINALTSLDVSNLTKLAYLECERNALTSLDVSDLTALEFVYCFENELTSLNVSGCTSLMQISCADNALTELDVSGLPSLMMLGCANNALTSLDESTLTSLQILNCAGNPLTSLDVSGLTSLTALDCSDTGRTSLDVSALTNLTSFYCSDNALTELNVSTLTGLDMFNCSNNALTELDVSNLIWLQEFDCSGNALTSMEASLTREDAPYEDAALQSMAQSMQSDSFGLTDMDDEPYINTVGNPLIQITVDVDDTIISLAATSGGYVEIDGDNYEFIAKPQALGRFINWTADDDSQVATTEAIAFNYDTPYDLTAHFELMAEVPIGISCTKTDATTYGGSDGSVTITASGGNSGSYEYSINGGTSWQSSGFFGGLAASTYTAAVRDAANTSNVATKSITVGQPTGGLTLSSTVTGGKVYTGGRFTLTPSVDGGTWDWDHDFFTATFNSPATFTALKAGKSTITYTVEGMSTAYNVTIEESGLPNTGQDYSWVWALCGMALILISAGMLIQRQRAKG